MDIKAFYEYCWGMNRRRLFFNSHDNNAVLYQMNSGVRSPVIFRLSPEFHEHKLYKMTADASYTAFAPWNRHLFSDSLRQDIKRLFGRWYGHQRFLVIKEAGGQPALVKIDGNRQITIKKISEKDIRIEYTDLLIEKRIHGNLSSM